MNVAVIGGSGFIGSHVVDKLIEGGHEVTVFDIKKPHRPDVGHIYIDITDLPKTTIALTGNWEAVYLLAAMANVNDIYNNPVEATQVNVLGTATVLEAARRNKIPRVILASTTWVYGLTKPKIVNEETPFQIELANHVYTTSKITAEMYCYSYLRLYNQNFTILRYGIPYGPRARQGTVLATFVQRAFQGKSVTIFGDGNQSRNFVYVEDLAEGSVAALKDIAVNKVYNLDGIRPVTVKEVADVVKKHFPDLKVEHGEFREGDFEGKTVSSTKAKQDLEWEARIDFQEGAERYIRWYKDEVIARSRA